MKKSFKLELICKNMKTICFTKYLSYLNPKGEDDSKAELLLLKLIHLFASEVLLVKKLEIEETKTT